VKGICTGSFLPFSRSFHAFLMSLAYLIVAHRNPRQVRRLVAALYHPDDFFILHFDRRAGRDLHALGRELKAAHPNVVTIRSRAVLWGGPQLTSVQIDAMKAALTSGRAWEYFVNLTGQDFPIKSRAAILERLGQTPGANHVSYFDPLTTTHWANARERLERHYLHWAWLNRLFAVPGLGRKLKALVGCTNRTPRIPWLHRRPPAFHYYGGANHVVLTAAACRYIVSDPAARRIINWLKPASSSDEIVYQSVLLNSPARTDGHRRGFARS
jgi:hypothetical protein